MVLLEKKTAVSVSFSPYCMKYDLIHLTELLKTEELTGNMSEELNTAEQKWLGFMIGIKQNWNMILNDELQVLF